MIGKLKKNSQSRVESKCEINDTGQTPLEFRHKTRPCHLNNPKQSCHPLKPKKKWLKHLIYNIAILLMRIQNFHIFSYYYILELSYNF